MSERGERLIHLYPEEVAGLLAGRLRFCWITGAPSDLRLVRLDYDARYRRYVALVESERFQPVFSGSEVPALNAGGRGEVQLVPWQKVEAAA